MPQFVIRPAQSKDAQGIYQLAKLLNSSNLPSSRDSVERLIQVSLQSFLEVLDVRASSFLFVLEDTAIHRIVGTGQLKGQHGHAENPHIFWEQVEVDGETAIQIKIEHEGPSELGGLIIDPEYRNSPAKLGRALSFSRLVFAQSHRELFGSTLFADLLPALDENGQSEFYEHVVRPFLRVDYVRANRMASDNRSFLTTSLPSDPVLLKSLPNDIQAKMGKVGKYTIPAQKLLESAGFQFKGRMNSFDVGPFMEASIADIKVPENWIDRDNIDMAI